MIRKVIRLVLITSIILSLSGCEDQKNISQPWEFSTDGSFDADISQDGKHAIVATKDLGTQYWDLDGNRLLFTFTHQTNTKTSHRLVKLADKNAIAVALDDNAISVWDTESGQSIAFWALPAVPLSVDISQDGRFALIGFTDHQARLIDLQTGTAWRNFEHADQVGAVALSPNEQYALVGSDDTAARLWDLNSGQLKHQWFFSYKINYVAISPDNQYALVASAQHVAQIRSLQDGALVSNLQLQKYNIPIARKPLLTVSSALFSDNGTKLFTGSPPRHLREWDIQTGALLQEWHVPKNNSLKPFAAIPVSIGKHANQSIIFHTTDGKGYQIDLSHTQRDTQEQ